MSSTLFAAMTSLVHADFGFDPTGKSLGRFLDPSVQPCLQKYSDFPKAQITLYP
ncbi:MAG TPA: hypothetical protein VIK28_05325 [Sedimentisphaerales bacterium]